MRLLLDTHIYLWWVKTDPQLSATARSLIMNAQEVYISSASIWEMVIKIKLGKLNADIEELTAAIENSGFLELPITIKHTAEVSKLPDIHRDPFDRILIAQAITEPLKLLTADEKLQAYSNLIILQ